ncbi:MAG TPA: hypothetical protein VL424_09585 [Pararobbsia sp.]|nr:hypothetical protein [Pararobbsia sp.]
MNTDNKMSGPPGKRRTRALEREKVRVRQSVPDLVAREAAEIASRQHENRVVALDDVRDRVTRNLGPLFERAFFECLAEWLGERRHEAANATVRAFIDAHLDMELRRV